MTDLKPYDIPCIFSAPLVLANLAGEKTQTRRMPTAILRKAHEAQKAGRPIRLWQRETFYCDHWDYPNVGLVDMQDGMMCYREDFDSSSWEAGSPDCDGNGRSCWKPSIHMPRWFSRFTGLDVSISLERVQDITEADAKSEGLVRLDAEREDEEFDWSICPKCGGSRLHNSMGQNGGVIFDCDCGDCDTYRKRFKNIWNHLHDHPKKPGQSWNGNPEIFVLRYRGVNQNIDRIGDGK